MNRGRTNLDRQIFKQATEAIASPQSKQTVHYPQREDKKAEKSKTDAAFNRKGNSVYGNSSRARPVTQASPQLRRLMEEKMAAEGRKSENGAVPPSEVKPKGESAEAPSSIGSPLDGFAPSDAPANGCDPYEPPPEQPEAAAEEDFDMSSEACKRRLVARGKLKRKTDGLDDVENFDIL
jgi:hypothetical protein